MRNLSNKNFIFFFNLQFCFSSPEKNFIEALLVGAGHTVKICGYLVANLIAFISVLHVADSFISWLFDLVHHPEINFQTLLGFLFYPFSILIGVPFQDCLLASKLIGIKVSLNEVSSRPMKENKIYRFPIFPLSSSLLLINS